MKLGGLLLGIASLLAAAGAHAGAYKCIDAKGKVSYQQQPCPKDATASRMKLDTPAWLAIGTKRDRGAAVQYFFDTDSVVTVLAYYKRARFKSEVRYDGVEDPYARVYYQYYDCRARKASPEIFDPGIFESELQADSEKLTGAWHDADSAHHNEAASVTDRICGS